MKKTDWERLPVSMDLSDKIPDGDQLSASTSTLTVSDSNGIDVSQYMVQDVSVSPTVIYATIVGGIVGCTYTLKFQGVTNAAKVEARETLLII